MNTSSSPAAVVVVVLTATALGVGCQTSHSMKEVARAHAAEQLPMTEKKPAAQPQANALYFETNGSQLDENSMDLLDQYGRMLVADPKMTITISGHTDERGSTEFNLALGDARARAARSYLMNLGVQRHQIHTLTLGEERPAVVGDDEEAWAKNRRDEMALTVE